ncbi:MAG: transposase, partial [Acidobacteriota bacterium]
MPSLPPAHRVDTFGGPLHVKWEADSEVTAHGSITYFIEFLKVSGLWEEWVRDCPLAYTSPNAPRKEEILGTILLSVLAGHKRYSHITSMRQDPVLPQLLGLACLRSEDSIRRAFAHVDGDAATLWLDLHLNRTYEPLLGTAWIL